MPVVQPAGFPSRPGPLPGLSRQHRLFAADPAEAFTLAPLALRHQGRYSNGFLNALRWPAQLAQVYRQQLMACGRQLPAFTPKGGRD